MSEEQIATEPAAAMLVGGVIRTEELESRNFWFYGVGGWRTTVFWGVLVVVFVAISYSLIAFPSGLQAPVSWDGDSLGTYMHAENFRRYGWTNDLPGLAYPFGGTMQDFPVAPNFVFIACMWSTSLVSGGDAVLEVNNATVLLVTVNALAAYVCLRGLISNSFICACGAILFALTYFAFSRSVVHTIVLSYSAVPLSFLAFYVTGISTAPLSSVRLAVAAGAALLAALSNAYFVVFSVLVFGGAGVFYTLAARRPLAAARILGCGFLICLTAIAVSFPVVLHRIEHGVNAAVSLATTTSATSELNALRLSQMITYPGVRPPLDWAGLYHWLATDRPVSETWSAYSGALVLFAGISLAYLIWAWRLVPQDARAILIFGVVAAGIGILTFVPGGAGDILIYLLQQIRALNRGVVLLQFVAVLICALGLSQFLRGGAQDQRRMLACMAIGILALPVFLYDQSRSPDKAVVTSAKASVTADRAFFARVEKQLPTQQDIFQLPYQAFPEFWGPNDMRTNDSLRPFILLPHGRTSAASFPGTAGFFHSLRMQDLFRAGRFGELMSRLTSSGFEGLTFDKTGLFPYEARRLTQLLSVATGTFSGGDSGRFVFAPIDPVSGDAPDAVPSGEMLASYGPISFGVANGRPVYPEAGGAELRLLTDATLVVNRYSDQAMRTVFQFRAKCDAPTTLKVTWGNQAIDAKLSAAPMVFNIPVQLTERQDLVKLAFGSPSVSCLIDSPAVTFFENS